MKSKSEVGFFEIIVIVPIALFTGFLWGSGRAVINYFIALNNNVKWE